MGVLMDNRSKILSCALKLFSARGYDAVGVQEIVDAAGITKPTLYHYFGSKRGLLETLLAAGPTTHGTGLFFDEQTPESLCGAIERFESQQDHFDPALARRQAERFAADRFERELVGYLHKTAAADRAPP